MGITHHEDIPVSADEQIMLSNHTDWLEERREIENHRDLLAADESTYDNLELMDGDEGIAIPVDKL